MAWLSDNWYFLLIGAALVAALIIYKWHDIHQRVGIWGYVGTVLGWFFVSLGLLGGMIPILPGFPLGILGLLLLGPNDPLVKWIWLRLHRIARRLADSDFRRRQLLGQWLLEHERRIAARLYKEGHVPPWLEPGHEDPPVEVRDP